MSSSLDERLGTATLLSALARPLARLDARLDQLGRSRAEQQPLVEAAPASPSLDAIRVAPLAWLVNELALCPFECDALVIALAPAIEPRYERAFSSLSGGAVGGPTVDLILDLLCATPAERLAWRGAFAADAPLLLHRLIEFAPALDGAQPPLGRRVVRVDEQLASHLLSSGGLDERLSSFCEYYEAAPLDAVRRAELDAQAEAVARITDAATARAPWRFALSGDRRVALRLVEALADATGLSVLVCDLDRLDTPASFTADASLVFREAWLTASVVLLRGIDRLSDERLHAARSELVRRLRAHPGIVLVVDPPRWLHEADPGRQFATLALRPCDAAARLALWQAALAKHGCQALAADVALVAARYRLDAPQIERAVVAAATMPAGAMATPVGRAALVKAARGEVRHDLGGLAERVATRRDFSQLVVPASVLAQLRELVARVEQRETVLGTWRFGDKLSVGKGIAALFAGPSGSGKTLAAEVIANELSLDLYQISLANVVSKYIGETEKNLDAIFAAAERANAILLFDEADALFGKRSEVQDAHDRYANLEISYLLQRMEQFEGVAILTTNLQRNLDEAFTRRLTFTVHFPFPDVAQRREIWRGIWPAGVPIADEVDHELLARQFQLSGGNIKNVALAAAFLAAASGEVIGMSHLLHAIQREFQKVGKTLSPRELLGDRDLRPVRGDA